MAKKIDNPKWETPDDKLFDTELEALRHEVEYWKLLYENMNGLKIIIDDPIKPFDDKSWPWPYPLTPPPKKWDDLDIRD